MAVHPKIPIIIVTLQFILLLVNNYFADAQNHTSLLPTCFIELLDHLNVLNTMDLTGSAGQDIVCGAPSPTWNISSDFSNSLECDQNLIRINETGIKRVRITCHDVNPLEYYQEQPPPFGGVDVDFSKNFLGNGSFQHQISVMFPERVSSLYQDEGLGAYTGVYKMSRESPEKWEIRIQLNITSETENEEPDYNNFQELCLHARDGIIQCDVGQSESEIYLVSIGGDNPAETRLKKSCLDASVKHACGNKKSGTSCFRNRYCKQITRIHHNGLARCSYDGATKEIEYFRDIVDGDIHTNMSKMWDHRLVIKIERDDGDNLFNIPYPVLDENDAAVEHPECGDILTVFPIQQVTETVFDQDKTKFECHFSPYFLVPPVRWLVQWSNGSFDQHFIDNRENIFNEKKIFYDGESNISFPVKSSHVQILTRLGMVNVICEAMYWNSTVFARNVQPVRVKESMPPKFALSHEDFTPKNVGDSLELNCQVKEDVQPQPGTFEWKLHGQVLGGETNSELKFLKLATSDAGTYECTAFNFRGKASKTFQVHVSDTTKKIWIIVVTTLIVLVLMLGLTLAGAYKALLKRGTRLSQVEIKEFMNGNGKKGEENHSENIDTQQMAYNKDYEIPWNQFKLDAQKLGGGVHGVVFKGKLGELPIAVKTVREGVTREVLKALLDELKIMIYLGKHEHIVTLKGACTQFLDEGRAYVLVEFCPLGSMESFLRKNREFLRSQILGGGYENINAAEEGLSMRVESVARQHFMKWSYQIAQGMKYLEEKKVVHADLAIRNILMSSIDHVKITDFGLSRQLINTNTYVKKTRKVLLPWKYMAPESLTHFNFTSKSDVWSYGVTLWEIFTVGSTPYPGMSWSTKFTQYLEENLRMFRPKHAPEEMYKLMIKCWEFEPESRPSFAELEMILREMM